MGDKTTIVKVPVDHTGAKSFTQLTSNVSIGEYREGPVLFVTTTIPFSLKDLQQKTGIMRPGEVAQWLQQQISALEEMLYDYDSNVHGEVDQLIDAYIAYEREEGELANNPCGGCHSTHVARRLGRGRSR